jgi:primase-polymerase (primpol)-like protein
MSNPNTAKLVTERDELKAELVEKQKYILFLEAEVERLQEALEFYAGRENWHPQRDYLWTTKVIADWGAVAREALKEGDDR